MFWTLFLIISPSQITSEQTFVPIVSEHSRDECERAKLSHSDLIIDHPMGKIEVKCLRTDEPAANALLGENKGSFWEKIL